MTGKKGKHPGNKKTQHKGKVKAHLAEEVIEAGGEKRTESVAAMAIDAVGGPEVAVADMEVADVAVADMAVADVAVAEGADVAGT